MYRLITLVALFLVVAESTVVQPPAPLPPRCNIYDRTLTWVLEDCVCRPIQNPCLVAQENDERLRSRKSPLVPISERLCKYFIARRCNKGHPVIAEFPIPPVCGCKTKPGTIIQREFKSHCELRRYSARNSEAYTSYTRVPKKEPEPKPCGCQ